ncbi:MAG: hypothetical protein Q4A56_04745 [Porphyromonadaceae bacterium]|nr:hypothetical protein [Porphyromonadaceae bacterium]
MKKLIFSLVLVLATAVSFTACKSDVDLKNNIVKNQNYTGEDDGKDKWIATFTANTFTATCETLSITMTSSNWTVTQNADNKTGTIQITDVKDSNGGSLANITGTISKGGDEIVIKQNKLTITLTKKK